MAKPNGVVVRLLTLALCSFAPAWAQQSEAAKIYAQSSNSVLLIFIRSADAKIVAQGTGFVVEGGRIITNQHVVKDGTPLIDLGGARIPATVEATDDLNDLAVLSVAAEMTATPLSLSEKLPPPGSSVFAIGNPRGLEKSISTGVVAGVRTAGNRQLLQITTPISPGSSGGPVFDSSGQVIGVTVGSIEDGQNLNFAVPAPAVLRLLSGRPVQSTDVPTLVASAQSLVEKRNSLQYSDDANSAFQRNETEIKSTFVNAIDRASKADSTLLLQVSEQFFESWYAGDRDVAVLAAERSIRLAPSAATNLALAKALNMQAAFLNTATDGDQQKALLARAENLARQSISLAKPPTAEMYYWLGDTLEQRGAHLEADSGLRKALELNRTPANIETQARILRDLIVVADNLQKPNDVDKWFAALAQTGQASVWDWSQQATRLDKVGRYAEAGETWQKAAEFNIVWSNWCEAAGSFEFAPGRDDDVLFTARKCIEVGAGKQNSETRLSTAHVALAIVLNDRGVYEEALSHAKEATVLNAENPFGYNQQAAALVGLHRYQEAINAGKQAIRLSDGKYGIMHFNLGRAYFQVENWEFAKQSFEKAAELMPSSDAAAYNVGLCLQRLEFFLDAAHWYEEALRRNPNRTDKQDLLNSISVLRRR
jgi:S1-C subfamily serine protease